MKYYCPSYETECPYYLEFNGECTIGNPKEECSDYWDENEEEEDE